MSWFECRMKDHDGDDDWTAVSGVDAEDAAIDYAEKCEINSGGEMLCQEDKDEETIFVRDEDNAVTAFRITMSWSKNYHAREINTAVAAAK